MRLIVIDWEDRDIYNRKMNLYRWKTPQELGYLTGLYGKDKAQLLGRRLASDLEKAGISDIVFLGEEGTFCFGQTLSSQPERAFPAQYICEPEPKDGSVRIVLRMYQLSEQTAIKTLNWYIDRCNRNRMEGNCRLFMDSDFCGLCVKVDNVTVRKRGIITSILFLNRVAQKQCDSLYGLVEGKVSIGLMRELREEYEELCSETQEQWEAFQTSIRKV